jgi:DNA-binding winged helix-turn-helix (wHTH) protein
MERNKIYSFGSFQLNALERILFDGSRTIPLAPKAFDTLLLLVENAGRVLSKERMLREIWEDSFVEENNLAQNISLLRKILGET